MYFLIRYSGSITPAADTFTRGLRHDAPLLFPLLRHGRAPVFTGGTPGIQRFFPRQRQRNTPPAIAADCHRFSPLNNAEIVSKKEMVNAGDTATYMPPQSAILYRAAVEEESAGLVRPAGAAEDTALRALTAHERGLQSRTRW
ncbi:hypothetical protein [Burkholderia sp. LMG 32019]|uniref:hypothetical protein n=1 Tax=Burkholderia sp. LMG 32019 TaxID=3158173 RepID=UPI003C2B2C7C